MKIAVNRFGETSFFDSASFPIVGRKGGILFLICVFHLVGTFGFIICYYYLLLCCVLSAEYLR